jgi:hypothetical protein
VTPKIITLALDIQSHGWQIPGVMEQLKLNGMENDLVGGKVTKNNVTSAMISH